MKNHTPKTKKKFYNIEETKMFKDFKKWEKENPKETKQIQKEIERELQNFK